MKPITTTLPHAIAWLLIALTPTVAQDLAGRTPAPPEAEEVSVARERVLADIQRLQRNQVKIINGQPAKLGEYPWLVSLRSEEDGSPAVNRHFCGGSIVGSHWVITAAHCAEIILGGQTFFEIGAGDIDLEKMDTYQLDGVWIHPNYDGLNIDFDFAVIKVDRAFTESQIDVVTLAQNPHIKVGDPAKIAGWGVTESGGIQQFLLGATVEVISRANCNDENSYNGAVTTQMVCAGVPGGGTDTCQGDSGGSLSTTVNGQQVLFGATSWGQGCALPEKYGVYARLISVRSWISSIIN